LFSLDAVNRAIELHDSELSSASLVGTSALLSFARVYLHESAGRPGVDAGSGWYQPAIFRIAAATLAPAVQLPSRLADGTLRTGNAVHNNVIPAGEVGPGPIELSLVLSAGETLVVRGDTLSIELQGQPSAVETFTP
jgi:hypothetical protein